jgi:CDP-alcohol phosphatidyltransferase-like enzyme
MPGPIAQAAPTVEATYKARQTEGFLDLHFYRPVGFWLAQFFAKLNIAPTGVTFLGGLVGIIAGHLYFYRDLRVNVAGMMLHIFANALDNADGQLARLTGKGSREGRILDGVADYLVFVSVYVHLSLRYFVGGGSPAICLLAVAAAISHGLQAGAADYYRNAFLYFVNGRSRMDLDSSSDLRSNYGELSWRRQPLRKLLLALYCNYTRQQEMLLSHLNSLRDAVERLFPNEIPVWLKTDYRACAQPALRSWRLLMANTRMFILFVLLFVSQPIWYFWAELIPLNLLLVYLILRQKRICRSLLQQLTTRLNLA